LVYIQEAPVDAWQLDDNLKTMLCREHETPWKADVAGVCMTKPASSCRRCRWPDAVERYSGWSDRL
jgi:hypothetical protein